MDEAVTRRHALGVGIATAMAALGGTIPAFAEESTAEAEAETTDSAGTYQHVELGSYGFDYPSDWTYEVADNGTVKLKWGTSSSITLSYTSMASPTSLEVALGAISLLGGAYFNNDVAQDSSHSTTWVNYTEGRTEGLESGYVLYSGAPIHIMVFMLWTDEAGLIMAAGVTLPNEYWTTFDVLRGVFSSFTPVAA
jgi:hypothetical protein